MMECFSYFVETKSTPCFETKWTLLTTWETHLSHHWYLLLALSGRPRGRIPVGWGRDFTHTYSLTLSPPSLLYKGYWISLPRVRRPERGVDSPLPYGTEVKKRVEVYLYSLCGPHAQLTPLRMFIIWHLVSTSSVGHHKVIVQEHKTTLEVETNCQIINIRKRVRCVWLKISLRIWVLHQRRCFI